MNMFQRHLSLLIFAVTTTLCILGAYIYMIRASDDAVTKSLEAREKVESARAFKQQEKNFIKIYGDTRADWEKLNSFFVKSNQEVDFIESIEAIGKDFGSTVGVASIEADNLENATVGTVGKLKMRVDISGSWTSVMRTLSYIEVMPYKIKIDAVDMVSSAGRNGYGREWKMMFGLEVLAMAQASSTINK